ncbi:MAG: RnfABCDGE type electron transport complex subunit D [Clostridia bacterium]|nr:RnfABCDGE type electron transport complex subunit D [Clostridia bacterium]
MDNSIVISTPPHVKSGRTTRKIMIDVLIALAPAAICGIIFFLVDALIIEITAVVSAVLAEFIYFFIAKGGFGWKFSDDESKALKKEIKELKKQNAGDPAIAEKEAKLKEMKQALSKASFGKSKNVCKAFIHQFDFTSVVTGLILALILPSSANWYEVAIGSVFAIMVVKMLFGGTGKNIANPAATGRVFMFISFSVVLTFYTNLQIGDASYISDPSLLQTGATVLSGTLLSGSTDSVSLFELFFGVSTSGHILAGCIGETCKLALIVGYIYLVIRKVIKWWQPLLYIGVTFLISLFLNGCDALMALELTLSGGLLFGAIFMATDYVTSPKGVYGQIVYYVCLGILTAVLRHFTNMEVVSFVIILMNLFVPLIDRYIIRKPFGYKREKKAKQNKEGK